MVANSQSNESANVDQVKNWPRYSVALSTICQKGCFIENPERHYAAPGLYKVAQRGRGGGGDTDFWFSTEPPSFDIM